MNRFATENLVFFDWESRSAVPIKWGAYRYAIEADPILLSYAIGMQPVRRVDLRGRAITWDDIPDDLKAEFQKGTIFCAFNTGFDRAIWNYSLAGAPWMAPQQVIDARATALAHNLPDDLETLSKRLGGPGKQKDGKTLIATFCAPKYRDDGTQFYLMPDTPALLEQWGRFGTYADQDVEELRTRFGQMVPPLTAYDWAAYQANEVVNDNGAGVDLAFCSRAAALAAEEGVRIGHRLAELTGGTITSINQNKRLAEWVHNRLPFAEAREIMSTVFKEEADGEDDDTLVEKTKLSIGRGNVERLLDFLRAKECDDAVLMEVLELREFGASAAPKKFQAILDQNVGGRLYGQFTFNGAGQTGRFSGRGVQLQNLTRSTLGEGASDDYGTWEEPTVALITDGCTLEELRAFGKGEVPARKLALTIRPAFIATGSRTLIKADYRQVEARVLPWLSNSDGGRKLLADFHRSDIDPSFPDLYRRTAGPMTGQDPAEISSADRQRGKVAVLACIAASQPVLTNVGLIPIEDVTQQMRVWDGVQFVAHDGVQFNGVRDVWEYQGLVATADHIVWTEEAGPIRFDDAATGGHRLVQTGVGRAAVRTGDDHLAGAPLHPAESSGTVRAGEVQRVPAGELDRAGQPATGQVEGLSGVRAAAPGAALARPAAHGGEAAMHQPGGQGLGELRRSRDRVQVSVGDGGGAVRDAVSRAAPGSGDRPQEQRGALRAGEPALRDAPDQHPEYQMQQAGRGLAVPAGGVAVRHEHGAAQAATGLQPRRDHRASASGSAGEAQAVAVYRGKARVYDILNAGPRNRFTVSGVLVHNCGFGGGRNALHSMAANYRLHFSDQEAQDIVDKWRAANPWAPTFWGRHTKDDSYGLFGAARRAIASPMLPVVCGRVQFVYISGRRDGMLICILPSGRPLIYPSCRMRDYDIIDKVTKKVLDTRHGLTFRRARGIIALYGGRFAENITQAAAADLLREAIIWLVAKGYKVISHSHDEIVVECEKADVAMTTAAMEKAMLVADRKWAEGLPLAIDITERWYYSAAKKIGEAA